MDLEEALAAASQDPNVHGILIYYPCFGAAPSFYGNLPAPTKLLSLAFAAGRGASCPEPRSPPRASGRRVHSAVRRGCACHDVAVAVVAVALRSSPAPPLVTCHSITRCV